MANNSEQNGFDQQGQGAAPQQDSAYVPGLVQEQQVMPTPKPQQDTQQPAQAPAETPAEEPPAEAPQTEPDKTEE